MVQMATSWPSGLRRNVKAVVFGRGFESHRSQFFAFWGNPDVALSIPDIFPLSELKNFYFWPSYGHLKIYHCHTQNLFF